MGCDWKIELEQNSYKQEFGNLPAAILEVQITEIKDSKDGSRLNSIFASFQDPPIIRSIDIRETGVVSDQFEDEEEGEFVADSGTGKQNSIALSEIDVNGAQETEELVRFQYDGTLEMSVEFTQVGDSDILPDLKECYSDSLDDTTDAFHVMDYLSYAHVRVDLEFVLIDVPGKKLTCDKIGENITVSVSSNLGIDNDSSFADFYETLKEDQQAALGFCSENAKYGTGLCVFDVSMNSDGEDAGVDISETSDSPLVNKRNNQIVTSLATGRPNAFEPYTKNVFFSVQGLPYDVKHKAEFFIQGLYSNGKGNSFALPTHHPLLIIRDPPGGSSSTKFENVVTTIKAVSDNLLVRGHGNAKMSPFVGADFKGEFCTGGGFGAIAIYCQKVTKVSAKPSVPIEAEMKTDFKNDKQEAAHTYSVTWSYQTNGGPTRAGPESDIFVVPNLNVAYEEVFILEWDFDSCRPKLEERYDSNEDKNITEVPTSIIVDFKSPENKPAFSFYSRYHLNLVKIPEIANSLKSMEDQLEEATSGDLICCKDKYGSCKGESADNLRKCGTTSADITETDPATILENDKKAIQDEIDILSGALYDWKQTLENDEKAQDAAIKEGISISSWFDDDELDQVVTDDDLDFNEDLSNIDYKTALVPETLIEKAELTGNGTKLFELANLTTSGEGKSELREVKRIQFVGDAGSLHLSLSKSAMTSYQKQNCEIFGGVPGIIGLSATTAIGLGLAGPLAIVPMVAAALVTNAAVGCNYEFDFKTGVGLAVEAEAPGLKVGFESGIGFAIHIEHTSSITESGKSETSISFSFGK